MPLELSFVDAGSGRSGQRLCIHHPPANGAPARAAIVYVHPFAEEMNKCRRMAALQSRAFAAAGYAVLQIDLAGCGDSSGEFRDTTWADWIEDVLMSLRWMRALYAAPLWLWGARAGCLVAAEAAARFDEPVRLLMWQPVTSGATQLAQFLRLRSAAAITQGAPDASGTDARKALAEGQTIEVAGYELAAPLAHALEQARLDLPPNTPACVWLETSTDEEPQLLPRTTKVIDAWRQQSTAVMARAVAGPAFWQSVEIEEAPTLIEASLQALESAGQTLEHA
ncbi:MAG: hydrolase 2, exosortase A system-associated [Rubrivivax sp.]|nr:hydrolase 2, exosortase A system-associated [Rubrivivax sp.]